MAVQPLESRSCVRIKSVIHQFEFDYLKSKHLPLDQFISSPPFSVGGYDWALDFYPNGDELDQENDGSHTSLYLRLLSKTKDVYVESSFDILDNKGKLVPLDEPSSDTYTSPSDCGCWGISAFMSKDEIEALYCKDGMLVISCNISILSAPSGVDDSSGGLYEDIEKIWEKGEKFDVTFEVEGERISAHRFMLTARSRVFEAELHGPFVIKIHDMKAEVFKALLRFIYTDGFEPHSVKLVQDLFVASDRYNLQMLKAKCQQRLWVDLSIENVLPTLILAEQHTSPWLKEKCLEFASKSDNFTQLALTEGYVLMMQSLPSLLVEFRKKVNISSDVVNNAEEAGED